MKNEGLQPVWKGIKEELCRFLNSFAADRSVKRSNWHAQLIDDLRRFTGKGNERAELALDSWLDYAASTSECDGLWNRLQGKVVESFGHVKEEYGVAFGDEEIEDAGRRDVLIGMVQRTYSVSLEDASEIVNDLWIDGFSMQGEPEEAGSC